jgi:hypothetical protein
LAILSELLEMGKPQNGLAMRSPKRGWLGLPTCTCQHFSNAARVCFSQFSHQQIITLTLSGDLSEQFTLRWEVPTEKMIAAHDDLEDAAENAAHALAFLIIEKTTDYTAIHQSRKGTGVDWFLGHRSKQLFQKSARLEVSGLLKGDNSRFSSRIKQKLEQTKKSDSTQMVAYVSVSEFQTPRICFKKRNAGSD